MKSFIHTETINHKVYVIWFKPETDTSIYVKIISLPITPFILELQGGKWVSDHLPKELRSVNLDFTSIINEKTRQV